MRGVRTWNEAKVRARTKQGLGVGDGAAYRPAIRVQDFSSQGVQTRVPMGALGGVAHVHSDLERRFLNKTEFELGLALKSYKTQRPMDRSITLACADALKVAHPVYPGTRVPVVMTIDATFETSLSTQTSAVDIKPFEKLSDPRVMEKLSITAAYCAHVGMHYSLFTERSATKVYLMNVDGLRAARPRAMEELEVPDLFTRHPGVMTSELAHGYDAPSLLHYCQGYDVRHSLPIGTGIRLMKNLVWSHHVVVDLSKTHWLQQALPVPLGVGVVGAAKVGR